LSFETQQMQALVDRWREGDGAAGDLLCRQVGRRLELLVRKLLGGFPRVRALADTDDVFQEAVVRLLRTLTNLRPATTGDFFNLAAVHVRRTLIDLTRKVAARPDLGMRTPPAAGVTGDIDPLARLPDPRSDSEDLERWCRFHEGVESLPPQEREIISLAFYHGWSQKRMAEFLGVDERTIRRRWCAACDHLAAGLGGQLPTLPDSSWRPRGES
jgi:RNA polymerase sigma-70 factor (ECF subfamily)